MLLKKKANIDLSHPRSLVQQEKEPTQLATEDIKVMLIPSGFKEYMYTMSV
jgi:hypothetical protein